MFRTRLNMSRSRDQSQQRSRRASVSSNLKRVGVKHNLPGINIESSFSKNPINDPKVKDEYKTYKQAL